MIKKLVRFDNAKASRSVLLGCDKIRIVKKKGIAQTSYDVSTTF
jgi:hypothetical protein